MINRFIQDERVKRSERSHWNILRRMLFTREKKKKKRSPMNVRYGTIKIVWASINPIRVMRKYL